MSEVAKRTSKKKQKMLPVVVASRQLELFTNFFGTGDYSNTAELWDSVPKHCVSARKQTFLRDQNGRLPVFEHSFEHRGVECRVEVMPALIKEDGGGHRDYYPSTDEELVEEVLRKFFSDEGLGVHDVFESESWVRFTLSMVRRELKERGRTRSLQEIKRSIDILSMTSVRIYAASSSDALYTGTILSDVAKVTRQQYLDDGTATWVARLPVLISKSVNEHTYRQFNYAILMGLRSAFARYLHKRLSRRYTNAGAMQRHGILLSTMARDSGLLGHEKISVNVKTVEVALDQLVEADVLLMWDKEERRGARNRLEDVKYTMGGSPTFNTEMRKMNERHKQIDAAFHKEGLTPRQRPLPSRRR